MTRPISRHLVPLACAFAIGATLPAAADDVSDALHAALDAYDAGNLAKTGETITR